MSFIDQARIFVAGGHGGAGRVSFRREKHVPLGGPDGGDGGRGGHVIAMVNDQLHSLLDYRYKTRYEAANGEPGGNQNRHGANGKDLIISLPPGTLILDANTKATLADLTEPSQSIVLATGGRGGLGNWHFRNSVNQAPEYAQPGEAGESRSLELELKLIAQVGIIGLPNAGKSTLISAMSAARPKIADYPFTTLVPNLGVVKMGEGQSFVVADVPGLIAGAHSGRGLGLKFLKHIERTKILLHVIDGSQWASMPPLEAYRTVRNEIETYSEHLENQDVPLKLRPEVVVINKTDLMTEAERIDLANSFESHGLKPVLVSAATRDQVHEQIIKPLGEMIFCQV